MDNKVQSDSRSKDAASVNSKTSFNNHLPDEQDLVPTLLKGSIDPVYEGKAQVLNSAIQDIGMGWYQWQLFIVVGGWYILWESSIVPTLDSMLALNRKCSPGD